MSEPVLVQWAQGGSPQGWERTSAVALNARTRAPRPGSPGGVAALDASPLAPGDRRWVNCINVQGNCARADCYSVDDTDGTVTLTIWDDDPADWAPGEFIARVIVLEQLRPDPAHGGKINTAATMTIYAGATKLAELMTPRANGTTGYDGVEILPWSEFVPPDESLRMYGIQLPDEAFWAHMEAQAHHGWREWCDHLPDRLCEVVDGVRVVRHA